MAEYPIEAFIREIEALPVDDEYDLLTFIAWSARLASLSGGTDRLLRKWPLLAKKSSVNLSAALLSRCEEGLWDLQYATGEDLGLATIAAQDFYCFSKHDNDLIESTVRSALDAWFAEAEEVLLDEEAVETLKTFIERFPLIGIGKNKS